MTSVNIAYFPLSQVGDEEIPTASSALPFRRVVIFIVGTATGATHSMNLADHVPNLADIEGLFYSTVNNESSITALTWSTTTLTFANVASSTPVEVGVIGRLT